MKWKVPFLHMTCLVNLFLLLTAGYRVVAQLFLEDLIALVAAAAVLEGQLQQSAGLECSSAKAKAFRG